jgi:hypothetical protein
VLESRREGTYETKPIESHDERHIQRGRVGGSRAEMKARANQTNTYLPRATGRVQGLPQSRPNSPTKMRGLGSSGWTGLARWRTQARWEESGSIYRRDEALRRGGGLRLGGGAGAKCAACGVRRACGAGLLPPFVLARHGGVSVRRRDEATPVGCAVYFTTIWACGLERSASEDGGLC